MVELDETLSSEMISFVPWPPSWENPEHGKKPAPVPTAKKIFTETEKELLNRGIPLIVGVKDIQKIEQPDPILQLFDPHPPNSVGHFLVTRIPAKTDVIVLQREDDGTILLEAEKFADPKNGELWKIVSPLGNIGNCVLISNSKRSSFYMLHNEQEEVAICIRKILSDPKMKLFDVYIPLLQKETGKHVSIIFDENPYLLSQSKSETIASDVVKLSTRKPQQKNGRKTLTFTGRVKKPSSKNFILIHPDQPTREILLCGKCKMKQFVFDLGWPLSIIQGFAIFLAMFSHPKPN
ncbi:Tub-like protein [Histomonas meleagridis]|uniref:Tub-like protein n=1 Tax=Histomonas meleagridis TaxID=135588 RepID=UPI0035597B1D|nr:Tub-like protein [Histomonas meleagridis]KAH0804567.1 Tub-like protein [Histomonas meleagridis]